MNLSDLHPYLSRIGFTGKPTTTLETLCELQRRHTESIPFENLNPLLRIPVAIDLPSIEKKLVESQRGGYCFEHNHLLKHALETIGFKVRGLGARVLWGLPDGVVTARGHMLLLVDIGTDQYIADAGFGGLTLTGPLLFRLNEVQTTPHESFRLIQPQDDYILQALIKDEWKSVYRFNLQEQLFPDYEVTNWYLSNNPTSHFVTSLIVTRPAPGVRYVIRNNQFTRHYLDGRTEKEEIPSIGMLKKILRDVFLVEVPETENTDRVLGQLLSKAPAFQI
jgi:N-hydroxyarylamine O-acetyltransferase